MMEKCALNPNVSYSDLRFMFRLHLGKYKFLRYYDPTWLMKCEPPNKVEVNFKWGKTENIGEDIYIVAFDLDLLSYHVFPLVEPEVTSKTKGENGEEIPFIWKARDYF